MGVVSGCDEKLGIENIIVTMLDVFYGHGVHMMDDHAIVDLITFHTKIHTIVSSDNVSPSLLPLVTSVELLIQISLEAESSLAYSTVKSEIVITLFESVEST